MHPRDRNRHALRGVFREELLALEPRSVLDVGCGSGELLEELCAARVPAVGVEASAQRSRGACAPVVVADAARLPFRTHAVDVVTLRHVLHHLPDPRAAVREAARVAGRALVLAEPWLDLEAPGAELARRLDEWSRRRDRRAGRWHEADHTPAEMEALLPGGPEGWIVSVRCASGVARIHASELRAEFTDAVDSEWEEIVERIRNDGLPLSGSAVVVAVRMR